MKFMMTRQNSHAVSILILHKAYITSAKVKAKRKRKNV